MTYLSRVSGATALPDPPPPRTIAILAGDPAIRIGSRIFALEDVLEVRLAPGTGS